MRTFHVSLYLNTSKGSGIHPIYLRVYIDGKRVFKATGHEVSKAHWDPVKQEVLPVNKLSNHINADLTLKKNEVTRELIERQVVGKDISASSVKMSVSGKSASNIFDFAERHVREVSAKRAPNTLENYRKHLLKLEIFHGSKALNFEDIDAGFLHRYETWLRGEVGNNYTHKLLTTLRSFFNAAIRRKLITNYPFREYEFPVYQAPEKDYLSLQELHQWEKFIPTAKDPAIRETAVWFLFACYCGLRVSDWYQFGPSNLDGQRIRLVTRKTGSHVSMPISKPLARMIRLTQQYPLTIKEATLNEKLKTIARKLKIEKHITCHTARHTFAVTICLQGQISSETAAELMGITLKTFVDNYSQVSDQKIDRETKEAWGRLK